MIRLMVFLLLGLIGGQAQAGLVAKVDRSQLGLGETLELVLESQGATVFVKPDLRPLDERFEVLDTRQANQTANVDGNVRALTRWLITLRPRQTGYVMIPPLRLGDQQSEAITLYVLQSRALSDVEQLAPVFIDASLDQDSVYVQAQVILTLRIYHSVSLYDDSTLSPLRMAEALIERLGEPRTYEKNINGIRHGVIEVRYAVYPQESGNLVIPAQLFSATTVANTADHGMFGPRPGKTTQVKSPAIPLRVKPKPAEYPADAPWLPAQQLSLVEAWSPEPEGTLVGESLTRSLLLKARGLTSSQLPSISGAQVSGLRRYPDQPSLANQVDAEGVTGSREQREALVPLEAGPLELPAVTLVWWNTLADRLEHASLPARTLQVDANGNLPQAETGPSPSDAPLWPWQLLSALLAGSTLLGFALWLHARRQPAILRAAASGPSSRSLLDDLKRACLAKDTQATRQALDAWARQQPETLAEMAARFIPLSDALDDLNGALYSETGQHWQGEALWRAIQALPPANPPATEQEQSSLPPLYPR